MSWDMDLLRRRVGDNHELMATVVGLVEQHPDGGATVWLPKRADDAPAWARDPNLSLRQLRELRARVDALSKRAPGMLHQALDAMLGAIRHDGGARVYLPRRRLLRDDEIPLATVRQEVRIFRHKGRRAHRKAGAEEGDA